MILADSAIPFIQDALPPTLEARYLPARSITRESLGNARILLIRTRTLCNAELLEGSQVKLIATATIGTDHIDLPYCHAQGITVANAPGCNAWGVVQWVIAALHSMVGQLNMTAETLRVGIIGRGEVGARLTYTLSLLGIPHLACDPPRAEKGEGQLVPLERVLRECNALTVHTPLTNQGAHPTQEMIDTEFLTACRPGTLILNAARGEIVNASALLQAQRRHHIAGFALDVYPGEPTIDPVLLTHALIATPHIAGYSLEGKWNASRAVLLAAAHYLNETWDLPPLTTLGHPPLQPPTPLTLQTIASTYPIAQDSHALRAQPHLFEQLRTHYSYRRDGGLSQLPFPGVSAKETPYEII